MSAVHLGSCLCGQVRFEVRGDFQSFYLCHCKYCQKDTGSAHAANLFSTTAKLAWVQGQEQIKIYSLPETRHAKSFCATCSSALPMQDPNGPLIMVPAGALDGEVPLKPQAHLFCSSQASWESLMQDIPRHETFPPAKSD